MAGYFCKCRKTGLVFKAGKLLQAKINLSFSIRSKYELTSVVRTGKSEISFIYYFYFKEAHDL